jgi:Asp-tRNA(Asn)/Glu-tRNA(Gln) amidotransferase A subunit family amidase
MTDLSSLARLDGVAQADLCARGEVSADELFAAALARIDALNPLLRAVVTVGRERPRGPGRGPLARVPFLVKDASPWPGLRWSMGSRLFRHNTAPQHTPYGARLAAGGMVCVGKSAASEFGLLASTEARAVGYTPIHNIAGCPSMSVPLSFLGGVPIGSLFSAAPGADALLLALAYQLEQASPWKDRWPPFSIPALFP